MKSLNIFKNAIGVLHFCQNEKLMHFTIHGNFKRVFSLINLIPFYEKKNKVMFQTI